MDSALTNDLRQGATPSETILPRETRALLRCPRCRSSLLWNERVALCAGTCRSQYPVIDGIPILLNEENSVFSIEDFLERRSTTFQKEGRLRTAARTWLPALGFNPKSKANYRRLADLVLEGAVRPRVLVVGGRTLGTGMEALLAKPQIELIETDVSLDGRTKLVCDAHDLPFADESVDAVIAQAVLEHVLDPWRCVEEIHRVLRPNGLVYAETPFMQQVHGGRYDFTRFTALGHRRLFRRFLEIASGSGGGPGTVLAWSYSYFLRAFARSRRTTDLASVVARITGFWLKYFDYFLVDRPAAQDGAWGYFFLGRRSDSTLSDRELLNGYRGL